MEKLDLLSLEELLFKRESKTREKWEYYRLFQDTQKNIRAIEQKIYKLCQHEWENDYSSAGPSDRPDKICRKCQLIRNPYVYR